MLFITMSGLNRLMDGPGDICDEVKSERKTNTVLSFIYMAEYKK